MEHIVNQIILTGNLAGAPRYSHENHGKPFYRCLLEVPRLSGQVDLLPLLLPEELRSVVILRFFSGYTQAETAAALNIPQGTAATRQKRALALLKLELGEEGQA